MATGNERLTEIAAYWENIYRTYYRPDAPEPPDALHDAICHVDELLDVIREQQAQIDAMRPIVEAVAEEVAVYWNRDLHRFCCHRCDAPPTLDMHRIEHKPDCRYTQARAFVAAHPTTDTAAGEAESEGE